MTRTDRSEPAAGVDSRPSAGEPGTAIPTWLPVEDGEEIRWQGGPRIQTVLPSAAFAVVGTVALLAAIALDFLPVFAAVGIPLVVAPALWTYARVSRTAFVVTDAVAATRHGVLGRTVRTVSLERIQNTTVEQTPIGRFVGYGTVTIETASGTEIAFWNVEEPARIRDRLEAERERLTGGEVPGSREQWTAVLEEVRAWRRLLEQNP
ncbi:PH domain-containing protein [Natrinema sp. 1APR25-10V2]|uniref:PH domain-containing protein n=1 Tax=Natrinema sp. 1APR25-10V2 TaxID=2951081 RepID=UPI002876432C|nr:PH domain-containing protein [Natrinema sp. 1APR25-10V2]MDS0477803.1 PH domain-containing protein [Natrinema sp. 1APR25-10V2]